MEIGNGLLDYAEEETCCLDPFAKSKNIDIGDFEDLEKHDIQGFLTDSYYIASVMIENRLQKIGVFFECFGQDKDGNHWRELHLQDEITGEWYIKYFGYIK